MRGSRSCEGCGCIPEEDAAANYKRMHCLQQQAVFKRSIGHTHGSNKETNSALLVPFRMQIQTFDIRKYFVMLGLQLDDNARETVGSDEGCPYLCRATHATAILSIASDSCCAFVALVNRAQAAVLPVEAVPRYWRFECTAVVSAGVVRHTIVTHTPC